jgi:hypothetical protein
MATANASKCSLFGLLPTVVLSAPLALSLTAFRASASPLSYTLPCEVNQWDGVALQGGKIMVKNTTGRTIPQDTNIEITVQVRPVAFARTRFVTSTVVAYRNVYVNESLSSGDTPSGGRSCTAKMYSLPASVLERSGRHFQL